MRLLMTLLPLLFGVEELCVALAVDWSPLVSAVHGSSMSLFLVLQRLFFVMLSLVSLPGVSRAIR